MFNKKKMKSCQIIDTSSVIYNAANILGLTKRVHIYCGDSIIENVENGVRLVKDMDVDITEVPFDTVFKAAYYNDENTIFTARKHFVADEKKVKLTDYAPAQVVYTAVVYLRTAWHEAYSTNLDCNRENIVSEMVDCKAFALAYCLSEATPFTLDDFPKNLKDSIIIEGRFSHGALWDKAIELATEYNFSSEKLLAAQGSYA